MASIKNWCIYFFGENLCLINHCVMSKVCISYIYGIHLHKPEDIKCAYQFAIIHTGWQFQTTHIFNLGRCSNLTKISSIGFQSPVTGFWNLSSNMARSLGHCSIRKGNDFCLFQVALFVSIAVNLFCFFPTLVVLTLKFVVVVSVFLSAVGMCFHQK